jgi:hypothetical protein
MKGMLAALATLTAIAATGAGAGGCARGECDACTTATLTANGEAALTAQVGDPITYAWSSTNANTATSKVAMAPTVDRCGNLDGPWVVTTLSGQTGALPILACQAGTTYTLSFTATETESGDAATATVTIDVVTDGSGSAGS